MAPEPSRTIARRPQALQQRKLGCKVPWVFLPGNLELVARSTTREVMHFWRNAITLE
jgi:hypothetical protein